MQLLYNFREKDGLYTRTTKARKSPLEHDVYLLDTRTQTKVKPPQSVLDGDTLGYWLGNSWSSVQKPVVEEETPSIEVMKMAVFDFIDKTTDFLIVTQFVYMDQSVRLSLLDQHNYTSHINKIRVWLAKGVEESTIFPIEIKTGSGADGLPVMLAIGTFAEYEAFEDAALIWVEANLRSGWDLKRAAANLTLEDLQEWEDPRLQTDTEES